MKDFKSTNVPKVDIIVHGLNINNHEDDLGSLDKIVDSDNIIKETVGASNVHMAVLGLQSLYNIKYGKQYGNFIRAFIAAKKWEIVVNGSNQSRFLENKEILSRLEDGDTIEMFPVVEGSGGRTGRIILGAALITGGVLLGGLGTSAAVKTLATHAGSALISVGVGLILQSFFTPDDVNQREQPDQRASFLFNGAVNTSEQGQPVPLVFGRFRTGGPIISAGLDVEELQNYDVPPYRGGDGGGGGGGGPYPVDPNRPDRLQL